jgi:DivIVA domain-containing protein
MRGLSENDMREVKFETKTRGYNQNAVNEALRQLELGLARDAKALRLEQMGAEGYQQVIDQQIAAYAPILTSAPGGRFQLDETGAAAYNTKQVDKFIDALSSKLVVGNVTITGDDVRSLGLKKVEGKPGYSVAEVDKFINILLTTLNAIEV